MDTLAFPVFQFLSLYFQYVFDYFSIEEIISQNMIETKELLGGKGVEIKLSIPVKKGVIEYKKIYYQRCSRK